MLPNLPGLCNSGDMRQTTSGTTETQTGGVSNRKLTARRFSAVISVAAVATVAGAMSYAHQRHLAEVNGQNDMLAALWPLGVDGLVLATSVLITADRSVGFKARGWAVLGFWVGVLTSVVTNALATEGGWLARGISAFPAVALLITIEALSTRPKLRKSKTPAQTDKPVTPTSAYSIMPPAVETAPQIPAPFIAPSVNETREVQTQTETPVASDTAPPAQTETDTPPRSVSRMLTKEQRIADRLEVIKSAHKAKGKDWQTDKVTYKDIEAYTGLTGRQTVSDLSKALYPETPLAKTGDI